MYGSRVQALLEGLGTPPRRYAVRVNTIRGEVDEVVEYFNGIGAKCKAHEAIEEAALISVEGPFEVDGLGNSITAKKHAAESVMLGSNLYLPGVMRMQRAKVGDRVRIEDPRGHPVGFGVSKIHSGIRGNEGIAVQTLQSIYRLPPIRETPVFIDGKIQEQSLPAILTSRILDPQPGETIVDMCAAPGGKTAHIAQLQGDTGRILAFEHSPRRIGRMRAELDRLGIRSVTLERADSRYLDKDRPSLKADRVLVDPPCTALGVRPKLYEETGVAEVLSSAAFQKQFLRSAARIAKPGGVVVYSTCTITLEENEDVVRFACEELGLELEEPPLRVEGAGSGMGLKECVRFDPGLCEAPGFFIARLRRSR
ncbi:MAG: RsmB/NOP family class I SAM-dependent RNA methyltransferase [Candidatus Methanosuratus sp.]|nr:RsmB/NOP family class I SAM-dependent RNA methyltransferase [Candidatus Methanosuratincola sp.]